MQKTHLHARPLPGTWHQLPVEQAASRLGTDLARGLAAAEAARRLQETGPNVLREAPPRSPWRILLSQLSDFLILVLLTAAAISGVIGEVKDTVAILAIVVLNAVIGFVQEYRAEHAIAALKKMAAASATVVREGERLVIPAAELVPGDVVLLEAGNVVPADLRLVEAARLKVMEAALTGESMAVEKHAEALPEEDLPLGERRNMAFKGTVVSYGRALGLTVATGMATELGKIAGLLAPEGEIKTPLQKRLARLGKNLGLIVLAICAIIFAAGLLRGEPLTLMFLTAVSLAVAAIPEALPAVVTVSLALGARKMVRSHALIRRLPAVETLGSVTVIASDKTGTLTQNRMEAAEFWVEGTRAAQIPSRVPHGSPWDALLKALALSNDASLDRRGRAAGDPTEVALLLAAREGGYDKSKLERERPRVGELPFDSERKCMTTFHRENSGVIAYTKGAPEQLLPCCRTILTQRGPEPLPQEAALAAALAMAQEGLRVIAVASRPWPEVPKNANPEEIETDLTLLALIGLLDPPRPEAAQAVALCKSAGIVPVMVTGDHPATARAIAVKLGIAGDGDRVMTGRELKRVSLEKLEDEAKDIRIYARVDPEQKIKIVAALRARGEVVAMTGDGVNDAPALSQADIGVAMGKIGTDVAREASAMVLLDDNFATIVAAVKEGRRIYDNIRKFVRFAMTGNSGEIWTLFLAPFLGLPVPLAPIQILWVNLVTDGLPGLALAVEPAERDVMGRPPRRPEESIFARGMGQHILWVGLLIGALSLLAQAGSFYSGSSHWQTMAFTVLALAQMFHVMAIRSERESLLAIGIASNLPLLGAVLLTLILQLAVIYVPALQPIFKTEALTPGELALCIALSSVVFFAVEVEKWMRRRGWIYPEKKA